MRISILALVALALAAAPAVAQDAPELQTKEDKVSYSIGLRVGRNLKERGIQVDSEAFGKGVRDAMEGGEPLLTDEEIARVMLAFQMEMRKKQMEAQNQMAEKNKQAARTFLTENGQRDDVHTTDSGLQYKVLSKGSGASPSAEDTITAHYKGTLLDGTVFDSSYRRGEPATFPVNRVIPGWTEVLQLMKVGSKWRVWIPSELAYGQRGAGKKIGPNAALVFEIELLGIEPQGSQ